MVSTIFLVNTLVDEVNEERLPCPMRDGLPYVPEEYFNYEGDQNRHHLFFPRTNFIGNIVLREFRALHIIKMPIEGHRLFHYDFEPPEVPELDFMAGYIEASGIHIPRRVLTQLRGREREQNVSAGSRRPAGHAYRNRSYRLSR